MSSTLREEEAEEEEQVLAAVAGSHSRRSPPANFNIRCGATEPRAIHADETSTTEEEPRGRRARPSGHADPRRCLGTKESAARRSQTRKMPPTVRCLRERI